jgi:hypothetical protein
MAAIKEINGMVSLDADQVIRSTADVTSDGQLVQKVVNVGGVFVPAVFDGIELTYVTVGNGIGEIATVTYKLGSINLNTLTLGYDSSNRLISVVKS